MSIRIGQTDRRSFIKLAVASATLPFLPVSALASSSLVIANWGGTDEQAMKDAFAKPFSEKNGTEVIVDTSGPSAGKIKAMVESGNVTWDICDATAAACLELGPLGMLEEIDYRIVDQSLTLPEFAFKWGVGSYAYSTMLIYDNRSFGSSPPKTWADFWNLTDFPGRRLLRADLPGMLEIALMADGVEPSKLYPLDVERGLRKIREIKSECLFWSSTSEGYQYMRMGETVMGALWNSPQIFNDAGNLAYTYNQGVLQPAVWVVPKNNPGGREQAMKLIAFMQQPKPSIDFNLVSLNGPTNKDAAAQFPEEKRKFLPSAPENLAVQIPMNAQWYAENAEKVGQLYRDLISS